MQQTIEDALPKDPIALVGEVGTWADPVIPRRSFERIWRAADAATFPRGEFHIKVSAIRLDSGSNHSCMAIDIRGGEAVAFVYRNGRFHHAVLNDEERIRTLRDGLKALDGEAK